ncbi:MAG: choline dehydrogenase-like flavoprotein [Cognaticolwellia sp.]|jgi:choline dehydrogenase-like flavoprotein
MTDQDFTTEVCVIGSGAGGGLAAGYLAEAGHEVLLLEEGVQVKGSQMTQREEQMLPLLYRDGGNQFSADGGVAVLQGRALGGSTVINMADVVPIPEGVLAYWAQAYGVDRFTPEQWGKAASIAAKAIGANRIQSHELNRNAELLLEGGRALGIAGDVFEHNRVGCVGSGYCLIGCAYGAKKSTALTWIPRGVATGNLRVQTGARVSRLPHQNGRVRVVEGQLMEGHKVVGRFRVKAERVILAAGAIHSPLILQASLLGGPAVGQNLSLQPQAPVSARFPETVRMFRGIPQAAYLDGRELCTPERGLGGFRIESVGATPGMAAVNGVGWGPELMERFRDYTRMGAALCLVPDAPVGRVRRDGFRPVIDYPFSPAWLERMREAMDTCARVFLASGAEQVYLPVAGFPVVEAAADLGALKDWPLTPASLSLISAHPQGTCRMGVDPETSVVDLGFGVHGVDNLQVLDASVFPSTASSHTMLPVMQAALLGLDAV